MGNCEHPIEAREEFEYFERDSDNSVMTWACTLCGETEDEVAHSIHRMEWKTLMRKLCV